MKRETQIIRNQLRKSIFNEHSTSVYLSSSFQFEDAEDMRAQFAEEREGMIYSRYANPNVQELIDRMAILEGSESGWATASGMSAIYTLLATFLHSNDHIVASRSLFGSTHKLLGEILPKWNIESTYVDGVETHRFANAIKENTKIIYIESPSNPRLEIFDIQQLALLCKKHSILLVVDNCFATPYGQQPILLGADVSIHSATKYIDGQGRVMGGLILSKKWIIERIKNFARHSGPSLSPFNAWILSKSLETLHLRFERHSKSALKIAKAMENHDLINWISYPFLKSHPQYEVAKQQMMYGGGIITFELKGGLDVGKAFLNSLEYFSLTANLGDVRSIATHPASTTHSKLTNEERMQIGISDGLIRLSIGLEDPRDLLNDLKKAFNKCSK